jgi:hypothetical protein
MKVENKIYDIISIIWSNLDYNFAGFDYSDAKTLKYLNYFTFWVIGFIG